MIDIHCNFFSTKLKKKMFIDKKNKESEYKMHKYLVIIFTSSNHNLYNVLYI